MKKICPYLLCILFFSIPSAHAQPKDASVLLNKIKAAFARVRDYRAELFVTVDVDFLKVPEAKAELLYKSPDKFKLNSDGFALLPKQGLHFSPLSLLKEQYTSFIERQESFQGVNCSVVKVIPMGDNQDIILHTLWIDEAASAIRKIESTTRGNGTFSITLEYNAGMLKEYPLPEKMTFLFDISKTNIPRGMSGDTETEKKPKKRNAITKGRVEIKYSDYRINRGLSDALFKEKPKSD